MNNKGPGSVFGYLLLEYLLRLFIGLGLSVWVARHLGSESYGQFNYTLSFVLIFSPLFVFGLEEIPTKKLIENPEEENIILGTSFFLKCLSGVMGIITCSLVIAFLNPDDALLRTMVLIYSIAFLSKSLLVIDNYLLAKADVKKISLARNFVFILISLLKLLFLIQGRGWSYFVYISAVELISYSFFYILVYYTDGGSILKWKVSKEKIVEYTKEASPVFLGAFVMMLLSRSDQIMIKNISGNFELAQYSVAVKLIETWQFLPLVIISALFPKIVKAKAEGESELVSSRLNLYSILSGLSLTFVIGVLLFGKLFVLSFYGAEYSVASSLLVHYSFTTLFTYFSIARMKIFVIEDKVKVGVLVTGIVLIINLITNSLLIPKLGARGAIWASLFSYVMGNVVMSFVSTSIRKSCFDFFKSFMGIFPTYKKLIS